jgi:hypothetical protein
MIPEGSSLQVIMIPEGSSLQVIIWSLFIFICSHSIISKMSSELFRINVAHAMVNETFLYDMKCKVHRPQYSEL